MASRRKLRLYCFWTAYPFWIGVMLLLPVMVSSQSNGDTSSRKVLVLFEQKEVSSLARSAVTKLEKGLSVYHALNDHSVRTQGNVRSFLNAAALEYTSYCVANAISLHADEDVVRHLKSFVEVRMVIDDMQSSVQIIEAPKVSGVYGRSKEIPWGLSLIGADRVWEMGIEGVGAVVGGHDTGVDWTHPAIRDNYRGWDGTDVDHNYNWHDAIHEISSLHGDSVITDTTNPCGLSIEMPCDDIGSSHGTHTVGTMVGYDRLAELRIGVAPLAQWIGVRNMERGYGSLASYLEGFEWFLAPTDSDGENPDPSRAPHVINNSWACIPLEGCNPENYLILETAVENLRAAGIVVVASAGNSGAGGCNTIDNPAAIFEGSLTVGSVDESDSLSSFSSRGLVLRDSSFRIKPNVTAPGRGVISAMKGGTYGMLTGTSMAGPHVAGLVALMISANPQLAGQVELIEDIIERTAIRKDELDSCSTSGMTPNALHGYGRIDAMAAVLESMQTVPLVETSPQLGFSVYPNPANSLINIIAPDGSLNALLQIIDATGRIVHVSRIDHSELAVDVASWARGLYFIQVLMDGKWMPAQKIQLL